MLFSGITVLSFAQDLIAIIAYQAGIIRSQQETLDDLARLIDDLDGEVGQLKTELANAQAAETGQRVQLEGLRQAILQRRELQTVLMEWETTGPTNNKTRTWKRASGWELSWVGPDGTERWYRPIRQ